MAPPINFRSPAQGPAARDRRRDARRRPPTQTYGKVSGQAWDLVRAAYVSGASARVVCERFGVGEANLRKKARLEGWTKRDWAEARGTVDHGPAAPAAPFPAASPAPATAPDQTLFDTVLGRAREALTAGKGSEATALLKALREFVVVYDDVADAEEANSPVEHAIAEVLPADRTRWREAMAMNRLRVFWSPLEPHELEYRDEARAVARTDREAREGMRAAAAKRARRRAASLSRWERA